jgi:cytochrome P450
VADQALVDVRSDSFAENPYPVLAAMRAEGRVHFHEPSNQWFLLQFDDVGFGLADIRRNERTSRDPLNPFAMDGPGHTGPRRLIAPTLSNQKVQLLRDRTQQIVDAALVDKTPGSLLQVVEEIGYPLPYRLMCQLLGVPELPDPTELRDVTFKSLALIDAFSGPEQVQQFVAAAKELYEHLDEVVEWKRSHRGDDLVSTVLAAADDGAVMTHDHVVPYLHTLYLAGMHTTVNQIALSLLALMRNRSQWELLVAHPELCDNAIEELLRYEPTAQYMRRTTLEEYRFGDDVIPEGAAVVAWIASANRDQGKWGPDADVLDIARADAPKHIAFGKGPHVCIGSWLARLELRVVIETLVTRYPDLELATDALTWTSGITAIRGPDELPLLLG